MRTSRGGHPAATPGVPLAHRPDGAREPVGVDQLGRVDRQARTRQGAHDHRRQTDEQGRRRHRAPAEHDPDREHRAHPAQAGHRGARGTVGLPGVDRPQGEHDDGERRREHTLHGDPLRGRRERHGQPGGHGQCGSPGQPQRGGAGALARHGGAHDHGTREEECGAHPPRRRRGEAGGRPRGPGGQRERGGDDAQQAQAHDEGGHDVRGTAGAAGARRHPGPAPTRAQAGTAHRGVGVQLVTPPGGVVERVRGVRLAHDRTAATGPRGGAGARARRRGGAVEAHDVAVQPVGRGAHDGEHGAGGQVVAEPVVRPVHVAGSRGDRAGGRARRDAEHREHVGDAGAHGHHEVVAPLVGDEGQLVRRCRHTSSPHDRSVPPPAVSDAHNSHGYGGPDRCEGLPEGER